MEGLRMGRKYIFGGLILMGIVILLVMAGNGKGVTINVPGDYPTIQQAIDNAIDGDIIIVSAGIYDEQIIIDKNLTIQGQGDATIIKPSQATANNFQLFSRKAGGSANTAAIVVANADATIKNLKIDGSEISSVPSGATFVGILYRGVNGTIDSVTVDNINISSGIGSNAIYLSSMGKEVNVEVKGCTISNFYKNGITANYEGLTVNIYDNNIIGSGPIANVAQNGIQIGLNAEGTIKNNTINGKGEYYTGSDWTATGILIYAANATVEGNTVINAQTGIDVTGDYWGRFSNPWTVSIINNTVDASNLDATQWAIGIAVATYSDGEIINANIENNQIIGGAASDAGIDIGIAYYGCPGNVIFAVKNNSIGNLDYGMYIEGSVGDGSIIQNNTIQDNAYGIYLCSDANAANVTIHYNNIMGNSEYGVYNNGIGILDAAYNYWGDATGPYHPTLNPDGQGDSVSDNVDFSPWIKASVEGVHSEGVSGSAIIDAMEEANTEIDIKTTDSTNVTILSYTDNPADDLPGGVKAVGNYIDVIVENESVIIWPIEIRIYYTQEDLDAIKITEDQIVGMYYWNGSAWILYNDTGVNTTNVGIYEGYVWGLAWNENMLSPKAAAGVDNTPPTSRSEVSPLAGKCVERTSVMHIYANDDGVAWKIYYKIDGVLHEGNWNEEIEFQFNEFYGIYGAGLHIIEYWAVDAWGNEEKHHIEKYYLDVEGPVINISFDGIWEITPTARYQITPSTLIILSAVDDGGGVGEIRYRIDDGELMLYETPFTLSAGMHNLYVEARDTFGNAHVSHFLIQVGGGEPTTTMHIIPEEPDGENGWYVSPAKIYFEAYDEASGVTSTLYRIDGGEWTEYDGGEITLYDGSHLVEFYSIDKAGNKEDVKRETVNVDLNLPQIIVEKPKNYLYIADRPIIPLAGNRAIIIGKITIAASTSDTASGVVTTKLFVNDELKAEGGASISYVLDETMFGTQEIKITAIDVAGHEAQIRLKATIFNIGGGYAIYLL